MNWSTGATDFHDFLAKNEENSALSNKSIDSRQQEKYNEQLRSAIEN